MKNKVVIAFLFIFLISFLLIFSLSGCWNTGGLTEETLTVEIEEVRKVHATIVIYKGDLQISGRNQQALLISDFSYNLTEWIPKITYTKENNTHISGLGMIDINLKKSG